MAFISFPSPLKWFSWITLRYKEDLDLTHSTHTEIELFIADWKGLQPETHTNAKQVLAQDNKMNAIVSFDSL